MQLPVIARSTPFDRLNLALTQITFADELTGDMCDGLNAATKQFNQTVPGGTTVRPVFYLDVSADRMAITVRQHNGRELPTRALFDQFMQALGLSLPEQADVATNVVHGEAPANAFSRPKTPQRFVPRHEGFRR